MDESDQRFSQKILLIVECSPCQFHKEVGKDDIPRYGAQQNIKPILIHNWIIRPKEDVRGTNCKGLGRIDEQGVKPHHWQEYNRELNKVPNRTITSKG